eukprot:Pgem_evm1s6836
MPGPYYLEVKHEFQIMNTLSFSCLFTAMSFLVYEWTCAIYDIHTHNIPGNACRTRNLFQKISFYFIVLINLTVYVLHIVLYVITRNYIREDNDKAGDIYRIDMGITATQGLLVASPFFLCGLMLLILILTRVKSKRRQPQTLLRILVQSFLLVFAGSLHAAMFLYWPIHQDYLQNSIFNTFTYVLAFLIPVCVIYYSIIRTRHINSQRKMVRMLKESLNRQGRSPDQNDRF